MKGSLCFTELNPWFENNLEIYWFMFMTKIMLRKQHDLNSYDASLVIQYVRLWLDVEHYKSSPMQTRL